MPKKSKRQQANEVGMIVWYKWEFLRRNANYRRDYEEFIREFGSWFEKHGYWYDQTVAWGPQKLRYFMKKIAPKGKVICERWQIADPFSPDWDFDPSGMHYYKPDEEVYIPTDCTGRTAGQGWDFAGGPLSTKELLKRLPDDTRVRYGPEPDYHVELSFDLRNPLSSLLRQAKGQLASRKRRYDQKHPQPTKESPRIRRRLDLYDTYLGVWDLRKSGEKFDVIGLHLFGEVLGRTQRAIDSFARARELIEGGYKELR
jgi:hypothetical protein